VFSERQPGQRLSFDCQAFIRIGSANDAKSVCWGIAVNKLVLGIAALTALIVSPALGADMPLKAPPMMPVWSWTGFYFGIEGGDGWGSTRHTNAVTGINSGTDNNLDGGLFGATYGYNWQSGALVLGLEGDISWTGISDTFKDNGSGFCGTNDACHTQLNWLGTDRVRVGYASNRYLVYATGGVAYGAVQANLPGSVTGCCTNETHTRVGYAAGGGFEMMFTRNLSAKLEYLYVGLGNTTNYHDISAGGEAENVLVTSNIIRAGLNYHFGGM
jgi:outer membrane immunogenic protein